MKIDPRNTVYGAEDPKCTTAIHNTNMLLPQISNITFRVHFNVESPSHQYNIPYISDFKFLSLSIIKHNSIFYSFNSLAYLIDQTKFYWLPAQGFVGPSPWAI